MDNLIKTLAYAGLGLASEANDKFKERFDELVEAGKTKDAEGKNLIGDFFKTMDSTKEDFETQMDKMKAKAKDAFPFMNDSAEAKSTKAKTEAEVEDAVEVN